MGQRFVACDREQSFLMPPDVREWLPPRHLAWFVIDAVAAMDLEAFYAAYRVDGRSRPPYDPAMMGWIQLVVATLDHEELRCNGRIPRWLVLWRRGCAARDVLQLDVASIGFGFGRRSLGASRARTLRSRLTSCRRLVPGGF